MVAKIILLLVALFFIDNAHLYTVNSRLETTEKVVIKAQKLLDTWHNVLRFTGGNLKLLKYYWISQDY